MEIIIDLSDANLEKYCAFYRGGNDNPNNETNAEYITEMLLRHIEKTINTRIYQEVAILSTLEMDEQARQAMINQEEVALSKMAKNEYQV